MRAAGFILILTLGTVMWAQTPVQPLIPDPGDPNTVYFCPMDPDVRSHQPQEKCPRCGMKLVSGLPDPVEYHLDVDMKPASLRPGQKADLQFSIHDPWKLRPVTNFQLVHEKLFHLFVVSQDLEVFLHDHPTLRDDGNFHYEYAFPKAGMYRLLGDFYPDGATPQLISRTVFVSGTAPKPVNLVRDYSTKSAQNLQVSLETIPQQPIAGATTQMRFTVNPGEGLEKYLAAWGHMLAASDDLIDLIHQHPFIADGGPQIQFNMVFPRAKNYRVWVQFQRQGVVNTAYFDVPVKTLGWDLPRQVNTPRP
jgi:hypothetical protein